MVKLANKQSQICLTADDILDDMSSAFVISLSMVIRVWLWVNKCVLHMVFRLRSRIFFVSIR